MKKYTLLLCILLFSTFSFAKKVKFSVDMRDQVLLSTGVHITGDFQTLAGYSGGDWMSNTTPMIREIVDTNIFSVIVDIPAFAKYEYKFLNGDQFYETEFVPEESRVGYNFNDNRWIYIDSLANDTTFIGAIQFSKNAPKGFDLIRFKVNMTNETTSSLGVHLSGSFQSWQPETIRLYSFQDSIFEYIAYIDTNYLSIQYLFVNGKTIGDQEIVPSSCSISDHREINVIKDSVLNTVCFSECDNCFDSSEISEKKAENTSKLYPNPMSSNSILQFKDNQSIHTIRIYNGLGETVRMYCNYSNPILEIEKDDLENGVYTLSISTENEIYLSNQRLIIQ